MNSADTDSAPVSLLRVEEAARRLGLSRSKTYQMVARGELPSVSIGRSRRVRDTDLERWVEELRGGPNSG